jgi:hypothetical protein
MRRVAVVAAGVLLLGGCAMAPTTRSGYEYPFSVDIIDESRASAAAPSEFRDRTPLPACEDVSLEQGTQIPDASVACIEQAGPEGAELGIVQPTTEGDPIVTFYRVGPGIPGIEIWDDATRDAFGGGWHLTRCRTISVFAPEGCETSDF